VERIALCLPRAATDRLAAELVRHGHTVAATTVDAAELVSRFGDGSVDVALVGAQPSYLDQAVVAAADQNGIRIVALFDGEADRRYAAALGLFELAAIDAPWATVEEGMARRQPAAEVVTAASPLPSGPAPAARGTVIAVWGPVGAPGRTTIAIAVAAQLATTGCAVLLADVDAHGGAVAPALGLLDESPGFAAACRLAGSDSLRHAELERIADRYGSSIGSFRVLTGIGKPNRWPELSAQRVTATIECCRSWVDFTVLDVGASLENDEEISSDLFAPRRNAATIAALRQADVVLAVGSADPVGLSRFLRSHPDLIDVVKTERVIVVMNRVRSSAIGLNPSGQVRATLERFGGIRSTVIVPHDQAAFDSAVLTARTLQDAAPRSPARQAIAELVADHLLPGEPTARPDRLRRGRGRRPARSVSRAARSW
jgi:MinD-like ATPase involved in chromosome partitioning or flagellar assembly